MEAIYLYKEKNPFIFGVLTKAYWLKYTLGYRGFRSKSKFERMNLQKQGIEGENEFEIQKDISWCWRYDKELREKSGSWLYILESKMNSLRMNTLHKVVLEFTMVSRLPSNS